MNIDNYLDVISILHPKDIDKNCIYVIYNRPISDLETHTDEGIENYIQFKWKAKGRWSSKINFKKRLTRDKEGHCIKIKELIPEDSKIVNISNQQKSIPICKANTKSHKRRNRQ